MPGKGKEERGMGAQGAREKEGRAAKEREGKEAKESQNWSRRKSVGWRVFIQQEMRGRGRR